MNVECMMIPRMDNSNQSLRPGGGGQWCYDIGTSALGIYILGLLRISKNWLVTLDTLKRYLLVLSAIYTIIAVFFYSTRRGCPFPVVPFHTADLSTNLTDLCLVRRGRSKLNRVLIWRLWGCFVLFFSSPQLDSILLFWSTWSRLLCIF